VIHLDAARQLLNFGARIGEGHRADEQLEGAVAIHNILDRHGVAYLADEVGMGKTYVALGAVALFRHFNPGFRLLVIAPRENIQLKWMKELSNFAAHNVRFADLRVKAIDGQPARPLVKCDSLLGLVHEAAIDPNRDFFARLTSFSFALGNDSETWKRTRARLRETLPWVRDDVLKLHDKEEFKDNFARAICCALPPFDLVIVDEAHNLKHGFGAGVAARNRVLALAFGRRAKSTEPPNQRLFPGYGPRAKRVLFLSATPLEESYRHVWNQLDVLGHGDKFPELTRAEVADEVRKSTAAKFLVRRVTAIRIGNDELTKNQYRREWRSGGVALHDQPISVKDPRQRLIVALVQKKVSELLGHERFGTSFQVGMLASFESFLETARVRQADDTVVVFDDKDQTDDTAEREGLDVHQVNRLARDYRATFGREMPHPKMDAVVDGLADAWTTGKKSLVFVRRVASVRELKRRLDEQYDGWLIGLLRERLTDTVRDRFEKVVAQYRAEKAELESARRARETGEPTGKPSAEDALDDRGGTDTFFAWFFRGEGPKGIVSGANVQRRFIQRGAAYATFFEENHVAALLDVPPEGVLDALARALGTALPDLRETIRQAAAKFLGTAKTHAGGDRMEAAQGAGVELLKELPGPLGERARILWHIRYENAVKKPHAKEAPDVADWLEQPTFFTELRRPARADLRARLWPEPKTTDQEAALREREQRSQLLATAARLGHAFIDLYILTIARLGSLDLRTQESAPADRQPIDEYLALLEQQRTTPLDQRPWAAFDELSEIASHFDLILDVNAPDARKKPLSETARFFGSLLRAQEPVGGMSGQVNRTRVQQFRMPGYPFVLVTTDLLQEGEDLHTFCSSIHHYGISWTPSAMEQRIGRIDRVRSHTDRRLAAARDMPAGADLLQVYYPHLEDTVEVLQVQRVLDRMNQFLRLMHEGLSPAAGEERRIDVGRELVAGRRRVEAIRDRLRSAFPLPDWSRTGDVRALAVEPARAEEAGARFEALCGFEMEGVRVAWERPGKGRLLGTVHLANGRVQPFGLYLGSDGERLIVRCVSPIGRVEPEAGMKPIAEAVATEPARIGALLTRDERAYELTAEDDVMLGAPEHDVARVGLSVRRVVERADALERTHLPDQDQPLAAWQTNPEEEDTGAGA
jgi:hypothetical protein